MAGMHWQIRTTESNIIPDGLWYAEPVFNIIENRLGIMDDIFLGWLPAIDDVNDFVINTKYSLSGKSGPYSRMRMHWDAIDELNVIHMHPNHPYMENSEIPSSIAVFSKTAQTMIKATPDEKFNNGSANSIEDFTIQDGYYEHVTLNVESTTDSVKQYAGNGFIWVDNPSDKFNITLANIGGVDNSFAIKNKNNGNQTFHVVGRNALGIKVEASDAMSHDVCRGIGFRSWCYTPFINTEKLTFSMVLKTSAPNLNFTSRIGYPGNWQFFTHKITSAGQKHIVMQFDPSKIKKENLSKPLCIDWFYDAYYDQGTFPFNTELNIVLGCLSVHYGWYEANRLNPAFMQVQLDRQQQTLYGLREYIEYKYQANGEVIFPSPMLNNGYRLYLTSSKNITVLEKTRYGFSYSSDAEDGEEWSLTYSAKIVGEISDIV